jgi:aldehyde:ferredoxin oxidoreductase
MYLRNNRVGVFDLSSNESSEQELGDETNWDRLSALYIADKLASEHGTDSLVLGTGVLTSSFVPAACAGILRGSPEKNGDPRVMPLLGFAGVELKLSGFDFIVLKGDSDSPGYVWIRDGIMEFVESEEMKRKDSWARTDKIRADQGDNKIQVLSNGPWGDSVNPASQLATDYWGGEDKSGIGADLGRKNLLAIAFRGMGELELSEPDGHLQDSMVLMAEHIQRLGKNEGLASYSKALEREDFKKLLHRNVACYGCPFPCRSFLKTSEPANEMRLVANEPGYLHYDIPALEKAFALGFDATDATMALMKCARAGAEPVTALSYAAERSAKVSLESVDAVLSDQSSISRSRALGNFELSFQDKVQYRSCLGLGLCPRYWSKVGYDEDAVTPYGETVLGLSSRSK